MSAIGMPQTSPVETEEVGSLALNGCDHQGHNLCARHREDRVDRPRGGCGKQARKTVLPQSFQPSRS